MNEDERLKSILRELKAVIKTESALINWDGELILSEFSFGFRSNELFGAMSTTMVGAAKNITAECRKGLPKRIIIQTGNALIIITNTGSKALLMCMIDAIKDLDRVMAEIDKAAEKIKELL